MKKDDQSPLEEKNEEREEVVTEEKNEERNIDYKDQYLRAIADYQNLQKQTAKDRLDFIQFANQEIIIALLPILNNFKEATKHVPDADKEKSWVVGIFHIQRQLEDLLKNMGVEEIVAEGQFDPTIHEAISHQPSTDQEDNDIINVISPGYKLNNKVIVPAKVVVAKKN